MKQILVTVTAIFLCILPGCTPLADETPLSAGTNYPIQFHIDFQEETLPFPATKSMPGQTIPEPEAYKSADATGTYNRLEYMVYKDGETVPLKKRHYTESDTDFGIVYDSLPEGKYRIGFLAHSSPHPVLSEENVFSFDSISDTFFLLKEIEIRAGEEISPDITLERIVSRIEFVATDEVPAHLSQFDVKIGRYPDRFSLFGQQGITATDTVSLSRVYSGKETGQKNTVHAFYCFIPPQAEKIGVRLEARNAEKETYYARTIEISPLLNKIIRYTGRLYTVPFSDDTFVPEINSAWGGTIENELPD
ncbi:MAG: hypothetical protein LIP00_08540 [Parabacteroides sp.]|nr:hypothetical protein [Parabacteroides sp.]